MQPVLKYPGAKWRLADWVIGHMPPHESYLEPFFGSGAVFFNKPPARIETINDIDGAVVHFFKVCRDYPEELARAVGLTPWAREKFLFSKFIEGEAPEDDVERARQFAVRCWMTFGARTSCKTGWRHTTSKTKNGGPDNPAMWARLPHVISEVGKRLLQAQIHNKPAIDVIRSFNGPEVLIYADPPYPKSTRTLNGDQYRYEMNDEDHVALLDALNDHQGSVLLSGYDCDLYQDILKGWRCERKNTTAERGAKRTECLWIKGDKGGFVCRQLTM